MRCNQPVSAEKINERKRLNNGGCNKRHHNDISKKRFAGDGCPRYGIRKKKHNNDDDDCRDDGHIETMPERLERIGGGKIFVEVVECEIGYAELTTFEKTQLQNGPYGEKHKKEKQQRYEYGHGRYDKPIDLHSHG